MCICMQCCTYTRGCFAEIDFDRCSRLIEAIVLYLPIFSDSEESQSSSSEEEKPEYSLSFPHTHTHTHTHIFFLASCFTLWNLVELLVFPIFLCWTWSTCSRISPWVLLLRMYCWADVLFWLIHFYFLILFI